MVRLLMLLVVSNRSETTSKLLFNILVFYVWPLDYERIYLQPTKISCTYVTVSAACLFSRVNDPCFERFAVPRSCPSEVGSWVAAATRTRGGSEPNHNNAGGCFGFRRLTLINWFRMKIEIGTRFWVTRNVRCTRGSYSRACMECRAPSRVEECYINYNTLNIV